jgi:hypothetical protein
LFKKRCHADKLQPFLVWGVKYFSTDAILSIIKAYAVGFVLLTNEMTTQGQTM